MTSLFVSAAEIPNPLFVKKNKYIFIKGESFEITPTVPLIVLGGLIVGLKDGCSSLFYSHARSAHPGLSTKDETSETKLYLITKSLKGVFTKNERLMID